MCIMKSLEEHEYLTFFFKFYFKYSLDLIIVLNQISFINQSLLFVYYWTRNERVNVSKTLFNLA